MLFAHRKFSCPLCQEEIDPSKSQQVSSSDKRTLYTYQNEAIKFFYSFSMIEVARKTSRNSKLCVNVKKKSLLQILRYALFIQLPLLATCMHIYYTIKFYLQQHCDVCPLLAAMKPKVADPVSKTLHVIIMYNKLYLQLSSFQQCLRVKNHETLFLHVGGQYILWVNPLFYEVCHLKRLIVALESMKPLLSPGHFFSLTPSHNYLPKSLGGPGDKARH